MSFHFRKAGKNVAALTAAVQAETSTPQVVRDELCKRIEAYGSRLDTHYKGCCLVVAAVGHIEVDAEGRPLLTNASLTEFSVNCVPFIDTPEVAAA